ncbi:MAG: hypothetical protein K2O59_12745 [Lachnospiraceae bacterium]|nr:hypothetical protein [Lachnospiraceae bacterium]
METNRNVAVSFEEFVSVMQGRLQARYPDCKVRAVPVDKNNGIHLTGIVIMPEEQNVAPNIYMENFYGEYLAGRQIEDVAADAARLYEEHKIQEEPILPDVADFEAIKDLICFRLINMERNREVLKSMPHRQFLDLAVTYYIPVTVTGSTGRIAVTDSHFCMWGVDEETLYRHAVENTRRILPVELRSMEEVAREILSEENSGIELPEKPDGVPDFPMYILRCVKEAQATAAAFLYESVLREFADRHGDFYILPSSVFEVMLLPAANPSPWDSAYYRSMVREVNRTQRLTEEVLSDSAYLYHAGTGKIEIFP